MAYTQSCEALKEFAAEKVPPSVSEGIGACSKAVPFKPAQRLPPKAGCGEQSGITNG